MSLKFKDPDTEAQVLAGFLQGPRLWRLIPEAWFTDPIALKTYQEFRKFLKEPYSTFPTSDLIVEKADDPNVKLFVVELSKRKIEAREHGVRLYDLFEMYALRKVDDITRSIPNELEKSRVTDVIRAKISELADLVNPFIAGMRERGFIYDSAKLRWERYRDIERDPTKLGTIPFHIRELDKYTSGGLYPDDIVMLFAETGGFKTKTKANLAFNFAYLERKDVMVVTLELPKTAYETIIDSRHALIDFNEIRSGRLQEKSRSLYRESLIKTVEEKPSLYIVDIPGEATSADLISELELYRARFGKYPDVLLLDYLNEMSPVGPWRTTSEKFKNLGVEIRRIFRSVKLPFIGSMQENRAGKLVKEKAKVGLEHVGESHYFSNVCYLVINLWQDDSGTDEAANALNWGIKKNRNGPHNVNFVTFCNGALNYVGDREVHVGGH